MAFEAEVKSPPVAKRLPGMIPVKRLVVKTAEVGTSWTSLPRHAAVRVIVINKTGTQIDVKPLGNDEWVYALADGEEREFYVMGRADDLALKRHDDSNTPVNVLVEVLEV